MSTSTIAKLRYNVLKRIKGACLDVNKNNLLERDLNLRPPDWRAGALPTELSSPTLAVSLFCQYNHIDQLTSNVSKRIGIIQRIKYYLPSSTLNLLGNALVMPLFDYCSSVWSNCNVQYSNSLQILHNRLARILLSADSRTSVNDLMTKLSWNKLEQRWNDQLLITTFKCLQGNAPSYLSSNFLFSDSAHSKGTRSQTFKCLLLPPWKTNLGRRSFHFRAVNRWNKLSNDIRLNFSTMTTHIFKNAISTH